jgi:cyclophilin family peptidyl-prolyl cis-trans isomerase
MSKRSKKSSRQARPDPNRNFRIGAIAVIILVVVVIVVLVARSLPKSQQTAQTTPPTQAAGQVGATQPAQTGGQAPALVGTKTYASAPPMLIDKSKQYTATVKMAKGGTFVIQLYADKAPITVNSFVFLARQGYFDGTTFHRVLQGFMAQGGDPTGTGSGGPGYEFVYEANDLKFDKAGVLAMANTGPATPTNGSQFFITFGPQPSLDGGYTIFGQVTSGMDVVNGITLRDPQTGPTFTGDAIQTITITEK